MAHTQKDKPKLLARIRRLQGQLEGLRRAVDEEKDCDEILHTLAAFRGATNGLMLEVIEGHIRHHVMEHDHDAHHERAHNDSAEQLIDVLRKYLR
jgi:DNA-binding FrmR family transcriptional regulator